MSNIVTINFIPCDPAPANGYRLTWRVAGSGDSYTDEGDFTSSPAQFTDGINPPGTCYEGFLQSDCESGLTGSNPIPWSTPCEESGTATTYTLELMSPCNGNTGSNYLVSGGTIGDTITVRAEFQGMLQKNSGNFTKAQLEIFSQHGTDQEVLSTCYTDTNPHGFALTADTVVTMVATTEVITLVAIVHNSSVSTSNVVVKIIDVNGQPVNVFVNGCRGGSSTGGDC